MIYANPTWVIALVTVGSTTAAAMVVELLARRLFSLTDRRAHNDVAAAMFSVIGVTFAVLLAFVTMISLEAFDNARLAVATEATAALDVADAAESLTAPGRDVLRNELVRYLRAVVEDEWTAQTGGRQGMAGIPALRALTSAANAYEPANAGDANRQAELLAAVRRLRDARAMRQLAVSSGVPPLVWIVVFAGGSLTVVSGSFLGAPRTAWHVAMSATLAASGAMVVFLIIVLSQPFRGDHPIPPTPYAETLAEIISRR